MHHVRRRKSRAKIPWANGTARALLTDGRDGGHNLAQLELVQDRGLASCIETHLLGQGGCARRTMCKLDQSSSTAKQGITQPVCVVMPPSPLDHLNRISHAGHDAGSLPCCHPAAAQNSPSECASPSCQIASSAPGRRRYPSWRVYWRMASADQEEAEGPCPEQGRERSYMARGRGRPKVGSLQQGGTKATRWVGGSGIPSALAAN